MIQGGDFSEGKTENSFSVLRDLIAVLIYEVKITARKFLVFLYFVDIKTKYYIIFHSYILLLRLHLELHILWSLWNTIRIPLGIF